jgi:predicted Zn-dependent peptidase
VKEKKVMSYEIKNIKNGIKIHLIKTNKFKTNLFAIFLTMPLDRNTVTQNALIPAVLRMGTAKLKSQEEISIELENMYGATLDGGVDKIGDNQVLKFYLETLNDNFLPNKENISNKAIELLLDIVFNPLVENNELKKEYVASEKKTIKRLIEGRIDNKDMYAYTRCVEEMYKEEPYGLYKFGYVEDLEKIDESNLYEYYTKLLNEAKIDIFVSGNFQDKKIINEIIANPSIQKLPEREDKHIINTEETEKKKEVKLQIIKEQKDVTQGKLVIGLDINYYEPNSKYAMCLYNVILGESATSKMFQNVREKAGLAYSARSTYVRQKNNIFIRAGIEIENFDKALKIIEEQLEDMKNGNFSEEDIENAKKYMVAGIKTVQDEQDSEITYYMGQEMSGKMISFEDYINKINWVSRADIEKIANNINLNTIYFLKNNE